MTVPDVGTPSYIPRSCPCFTIASGEVRHELGLLRVYGQPIDGDQFLAAFGAVLTRRLALVFYHQARLRKICRTRSESGRRMAPPLPSIGRRRELGMYGAAAMKARTLPRSQLSFGLDQDDESVGSVAHVSWVSPRGASLGQGTQRAYQRNLP